MEWLGEAFAKELTALFFMMFVFLVGFFYKKTMDVFKELKEHNDKIDERLDKLDAKLVKFKEESDEADVVTLRNDILRNIDEAEFAKCISQEKYEVTSKMYDVYTARGGNGLVEKRFLEYKKKSLCDG